MSELATKFLEILWPWKSGPGAKVYELFVKPNLIAPSASRLGTETSEARISLVATPDYLEDIVEQTYRLMKSLYGRKLPLEAQVMTKDFSRSLRYGLVQTSHLLQVKGEKRYREEFLERVRASILADQHDSHPDAPQVISQAPGSWLEAGPVVPAESALGPGQMDRSLQGLGVTGLLVGVIAALLLFSKREPSHREGSTLQTAVTHLKKRGSGEPQLLKKESVDGGEKFYFQTPTDSYTVIVDDKRRVSSWSRASSSIGGTG